MPRRATADRAAAAVVVGAGPGGSAAAHFLAERGHRVVLLERRRFPRDKSCGDAVTRPGVAILAEMGALGELARGQRFAGVRAHVGDKGARDFAYPAASRRDLGLVVPRLVLDDVIRRRAVAAGAELREEVRVTEILYDGDRAVGVRGVHDGEVEEFPARFVVCADGATSALGRKAGLVPTPRSELGYAVRGYYDGIHGLSDRIEFYLPLTDPDDEFLLPCYGWVFPTGAGSANIGVGVGAGGHRVNVRRLFERFVAAIVDDDPRFATMRQRGALRGAPIRSDFSPDSCAARGVLLVGDAAGMVSPFTGEGISYALESGKLAAETIDERLPLDADRSPDTSGYARALRQRYAGYFETGREAALRYRLAWRVLESTFDNERPLFALSRSAALLPEGVGVMRTSDVVDDVAPLVRPLVARLRADLLAVDEVLARTLASDWPFLSRLALSAARDSQVPARPASLLMMCAYFGDPDGKELVRLAAAIELTFLAALAHASLGESGREDGASDADGEPEWGNVFALLSGNLQMAKALQLTAGVGDEAVARVTRATTTLCEGRVYELRRAYDPGLSSAAYLDVVSRTTGAAFAAVCDLGAWIAGVPPREAARVREFGLRFGNAYHVAHEVMSIAGRPSPLGPFVANNLVEGRLNLPTVLALENGDPRAAELRRLLDNGERTGAGARAALGLVREGDSIRDAMRVVRAECGAARRALEPLPAGPVRESLEALASFPYDRAMEELAAGDSAAAGARSYDGDDVWRLPERLGIEADIQRVTGVMHDWAQRSDPEFREIVDYQFAMESKWFRPATVFACFRAASDDAAPPDEVVRAAAAIELLHNATLVIDDVLDRDRYRRGVLALHCRFGTLRALMAATYWSSAATDWIADDPYVVRLLAELWQRLALAEGLQWRIRRRRLGLDDWRRIAREDTGSMFETCARLGTHDDRMAEFGNLLGTLYHGCDDVADVRGAAALGGGKEKDIVDRILTLPAAIAIRDPDCAGMFESSEMALNDELAERFTAVLPEAERVLDELAAEAEAEARRCTDEPERLLELVRFTRALSSA